MMVSATVHVLSVWGTVMPKNSLISQNPASLTCDSISAPDPVASTSSSALVPGVATAIGATIPAAVVIATVAEPVATRINPATTHASNSGDAWEPIATLAIAPPTPLCTSTWLKPPPAPITSRIVAVGARQSLQNFIRSSLVKCRGLPSDQNENNSATNSATIGLPAKCSAERAGLAASKAKSATLPKTISNTGINTVKSEMPKPGISG